MNKKTKVLLGVIATVGLLVGGIINIVPKATNEVAGDPPTMRPYNAENMLAGDPPTMHPW